MIKLILVFKSFGGIKFSKESKFLLKQGDGSVDGFQSQKLYFLKAKMQKSRSSTGRMDLGAILSKEDKNEK